jgi:hypothetical protein
MGETRCTLGIAYASVFDVGCPRLAIVFLLVLHILPDSHSDPVIQFELLL